MAKDDPPTLVAHNPTVSSIRSFSFEITLTKMQIFSVVNEFS